MRLFMVRHGQTTANVERIFVGQADVMLTDQGRQEALAIRPILENFSFDKVYTSDLTRAIETQQLALPNAVSTPTPLLREFDEGDLFGIKFEDAFALYGREFISARDYRPFHGETADMACGRLKQFLSMLEKDPCENVIAFSHNGMMACMLRLVMDAPVDLGSMKSPNCSIQVFDFDGKRWRLLAWNYMGKL